MGQYYYTVNVDKGEYLNPHDFGAGLKLMEFAYPKYPSMLLSALAVLLADGNGRGGGDLRSDDPLIGSWAGNRIIVAGDYADPEPDSEEGWNIYRMICEEGEEYWENISTKALVMLTEDSYFAEQYVETVENHEVWYPRAVTRLAHFLAEPEKHSKEEQELAYRFFSNLYPDNERERWLVAREVASKHPLRED